jgi:hypothetical protein
MPGLFFGDFRKINLVEIKKALTFALPNKREGGRPALKVL